jgi:RHS repeat-associated protein
LADGLGSTLALTDNTGTVQTEYTYEPFGTTMVNGAASTNPFQYTGRENDGTGLYYYRARYYHPELQRFTSQDPIGFGGEDINLYTYVRNDPEKGVRS